MGQWSAADREAGLEVLLQLSKHDRAAARTAAKLGAGQPPATPLLSRTASLESLPSRGRFKLRGLPGAQVLEEVLDAGRAAAAEGQGGGSTPHAAAAAASGIAGAMGRHAALSKTRVVQGPAQLALAWGQGRGGGATAFYMLESCGAEGSPTHSSGKWSVLLTDPPPPSEGGGESHARPAQGKTIKGLYPGTVYHFRIRAYNEFGCSGYAFGAFATAPLPPPAPVPLALTHTGARLGWDHAATSRWAMRELRGLLEDLAGRSPQVLPSVSRQQLCRALAQHGPLANWAVQTPTDLRLVKVAAALQVTGEPACSVWAALEGALVPAVLGGLADCGGVGVAQAAAALRDQVSLPELGAVLGHAVAGPGKGTALPRTSLSKCLACAAATGLLLEAQGGGGEGGGDTPPPALVWGGLCLATPGAGEAPPATSLTASQLATTAAFAAPDAAWGWHVLAPGALPTAALAGLWAGPGKGVEPAQVTGTPVWGSGSAHRFALLRCVEDEEGGEGAAQLAPASPAAPDGDTAPPPHGMVWEEVSLGQGCRRAVSGLTPSRSYLYAVQALNGGGVASALSGSCWLVAPLPPPPLPTVTLAPARSSAGQAGAAAVSLAWRPVRLPSAAGAVATARATRTGSCSSPPQGRSRRAKAATSLCISAATSLGPSTTS